MNIYRGVRAACDLQRRKMSLKGVYQRFKDFTMIPSDKFVSNLLLAERIREVPGCVIECGVWRGGMSAGMAAVLGPQREYFLFDSFEGLPPAQTVDGTAALDWQNDKESPFFYDNCAAPPDFAQRAMALSGVPSFQLMKGWFNETIPNFVPPKPIALLRLDGDWYESTMICLEGLMKWVAPGGVIILDDYYIWDGCSRALHDFLSRTSATERIETFRGIGFLQKRPVPAVGNSVGGVAVSAAHF